MNDDLAAEIIKRGIKHENGTLIKVKVVANSKQNSYEFVPDAQAFHNGLAVNESCEPCKKADIFECTAYALKLKIAKPAVDGKANEEIIKYLSKLLKIPKNSISIVKGEKSSIKTLFLIK